MECDDTTEPVDSLLAAVARIPPRRDAWTPPSELDEYTLVEPIGRGGMGSVWLARDRLLDRLVAVKFIAHAEPDAATRERFAIEARAAARLQHVNVVTVHRYGELAGRPYLVSEFIRGESLDKLATPIAPGRALELGLALARGLAAAHRASIVHRDVKPGNAILTADGDVKLVDFGLAQIGGADAEYERGTVAGTPRYLAPEVRAGEPATPRADVFGLGCILYELVTGRPAIADARGDHAPLVGEPGAVVLGEVIERCLASDPRHRFASGEELREALERIAAPAIGGALPAGNPYRGLVAFDAEHRALFFGRGAEIRAVVERLRADALVLVTGDSGIGKSSLCRAGVLPHVADGAFGDGLAWSSVTLVPGKHPLAALAAQVAHLGRLGAELDEVALAARLTDEPGALGRALRRALGPARGAVVFVDQLEELATLADRAEAAAFAAALGALATRTPGVRVLATVRGDFLTRLAELPVLGDHLARALYVLRPLGAGSAREAIAGPARAKGGRFESEALVDALVASVADPDRIELPLLAFTLAQLWDARDAATQTISARSLDSIGGVRGALARHADGVLDALLPAQRATARQLLLRLVTAERTRARRPEAELVTGDLAALDALVRGRLVVARSGDEPTYELAHERLIDGWPTLASWLSQTAEAHAAHARLATAAADWERLGRRGDALWSARQLAELARVADDELTPNERAFARASRRASRRRTYARRALAVALPIAIVSIFVAANLVARRDLGLRVDDKVVEAARDLPDARAAAAAATALAASAYARFDAGDEVAGEPIWTRSRKRSAEARAAYARVASALDAAFLLDTDRGDVRRELAAVTRERMALAASEHETAERDELARRLALYDPQGGHDARARVTVTTDPGDATVALVAADGTERPLPLALAPGSYVLVARRAGRADVRVPIAVAAGDERRVAIALPDAHALPAGYVYIPAGEFLYGSGGDDLSWQYFGTAPLHERTSHAFLIARTEVTYAQWIEYLGSLPPKERTRRTPHDDNAKTIGNAGSIALSETAAGWRLHLAPTGVPYNALAGEPIRYEDRARRAEQDWRAFPVSGISAPDAEAFAAWLAATGRVPHARLCTETEWEYAARGVDGRVWPHGAYLAPDDANIDATYDHKPAAFGPDMVDSHPRTTSPFGLADTSGNVWETVRGPTGFVARGGCYYMSATVASLVNRQPLDPPNYRDAMIGTRICADP